jgi:hypothetical protein
VQERFAAFHEEIARLDPAVGSVHFQPLASCPMFMPSGMLDAWIVCASGAFPVERR